MKHEQPPRCGVRRNINGKTWICIKPPHDDPPGRTSLWWDAFAAADCHYFVRQFPHTDR